MASRFMALAVLGLGLGYSPDVAFAQERSSPAPSTDAPVSPPAPLEGGLLSQAELEELLAPIALYPDQLLANVLAACMYPEEVAAAVAFVKTNPGAAKIEAMDWEPPVRAVALVEHVIKMMGDYPDWVASLGTAYRDQPQDVMKSVQALRAKAQANGALFTTPEQNVSTQGSTIIIQPAQPQVIYVPRYDPAVVYVERYDPWATGFVTFGWGVWTGFLISDLDCDWHYHRICWGRSWHHHHRHNVDVCADVNDWRGRPRPGQEGARWGPNPTKVQGDAGVQVARFRGAGETSRGSDSSQFVGPVGNRNSFASPNAGGDNTPRARFASSLPATAGRTPDRSTVPAIPSKAVALGHTVPPSSGSGETTRAARFAPAKASSDTASSRKSSATYNSPVAPSTPRSIERSKIPSPQTSAPKASFAKPATPISTRSPSVVSTPSSKVPTATAPSVSRTAPQASFARPSVNTSSTSSPARPFIGPTPRSSPSASPSQRPTVTTPSARPQTSSFKPSAGSSASSRPSSGSRQGAFSPGGGSRGVSGSGRSGSQPTVKGR